MIKSGSLRWLILGVLVIAVILIPFFLFGDRIESWSNAFLKNASGHSLTAAVVIFALLSSDILLPIPSSLVNTGAGFTLGFPLGLLAAWLGMNVSCLAGYWLGSKARNQISKHLLGEYETQRLENLNRRFGDWYIVITRAIPVLAEASVLFAGLGSMPLHRFIMISTLSNAAISAVYAAVGAFSASANSFLLAFAASIIIPATGMLLFRKKK